MTLTRTAFAEAFVDVDGFHIRYLAAGASPRQQYVLVYDAGHEVGADRPEAFASLVSDFLERHEAFIVKATSSLLNP